MSGTTNIESSVEGKPIRRAAAKLLLLDSNQDQRFQRPVCCRYTKEECARTHRTRMPDRVPPCRSNPSFADWIPGPIPWPNTLLIGWRMVRESNSPGASAPTVLAGLRLCRTAHHPMPVFAIQGHTGQASIGPAWDDSCGTRGVGRIRTSGGLRPCCFRDSRIRPLCHHSTDPHEGTNWLTYSCGSRAPGGIRTHDRTGRSRLL